MSSNIEIENNKKVNEKRNNSKYIKSTMNIPEINNILNLIKNDIYKYETLLKYKNNEDILNTGQIEKIINELMMLNEEEYGAILLPFLSPPCHKLLEVYYKSDLDEGKSIRSEEGFKYIKIFEILKDKIFISKENANIIYSYFGSLFYDAKKIEQYDKRLKKFLKLKELWKIFNTLPFNKENKKKSYYSFIGGKLVFKFKQECDFSKRIINIKINFLENKYLDKFLDKVIFLKVKDKVIEIKKYLKKEKNINNLLFMEFKIAQWKIEFSYQIAEESIKNEKIKCGGFNEKIESLTILENYYGLVESIEIILKYDSIKEKIHNLLFYPMPITEKDTLCYINNIIENNDKILESKDFKNKNNNIIDLTTEKDLYKIKINNNKLIKANYINYNDINFNIIEYFGGITQLLPFMSLIKNLFENKKIKLINDQDKNEVLISFVTDILSIFINIIFYYKEYKIHIEKYSLFFFCILTELDIIFFSKKDTILNTVANLSNEIQSKYSQILQKFIGLLTNNEKKENLSQFFSFLVKGDKNISNKYDYFFRQLYTKLMKELFIYNRNWSNKNLFFQINKKDGEIAMKYKQLNYYTKSFQQPFIYPILEMDKYYPNFIDFDKDKLYKNKNEQILNYDFSLSDNNSILEEIKKYTSENKKENIEFVKCCLVKKIYHVKGKITVSKNLEGNNESFEIIFISNENDEEYTCNKDIKYDNDPFNIQLKEKTKNICYGAIFSCPKKEYNKKIIIKSEDIIFLLFREYYHRVSAIEIFTNNNKSYYFNFYKKFEVKCKGFLSFLNKHNNENENVSNKQNEKEEKEVIRESNIDEDDNTINSNDLEIEKTIIKDNDNIIISNINGKKEFRSIIRNKILLGYFNKKYQRFLYPLFENKKPNSKIKFLSNYDILIFINFLSNRSFKDLYQYPILPTFYESIKLKRVMNKHIGLQDIDSVSKSRVKLFNESFKAASEDYNEIPNSPNPPCLFNIHYSNPIYTSNFLIRVFPYSFSAIELQGDGFDNPNRLFYSINSSLNNTLNQKSDVRELIPELFYFYELFTNRNHLEFHKLVNNKEIDKVKINNDKEKETDKDIYKFITDMRNLLEKEENLDEWIDLIFGIKSEKDESNREYYSKNSKVYFENKQEILNDEIIMASADFGLIPYKLFVTKFPIIKRNNFDNLKKYNNQMIDHDHFKNYSNPMKCFMCIGRTKIDNDYLEAYKKKKLFEDTSIMNKLKEIDEFYYYFVGNVFGNITIYRVNKEKNKIKNKRSIFRRMMKNKKDLIEMNQINENNHECEELDDSFSQEINYNAKIDRISVNNIISVSIFKKIYDHHKQIKYIDFNSRLNAFVTYALDGFINLYLFPTCKLINSIKVNNLVGNNCIFDAVFLISNPFPMIACKNKILMYIFDINFNFIHVESIAENEVKIHIDKNCGIIQDFITKDGKEYSFPFLDEIKSTKNI